MVDGHIGRGTRVEAAKHNRGGEQHLNVAPRLLERNGFNELGRFAEGTPRTPKIGSARAGIVGGERYFRLTRIRIQQVAEIVSSQLDVAIDGQQLRGAQAANAEVARELLSR